VATPVVEPVPVAAAAVVGPVLVATEPIARVPAPAAAQGQLALGPTLRTARYLRPEQLLARTTFLAERRLAHARPGLLARLYQRRLARIQPHTVAAAPLWRWPPAPLDPAARAHPERADDLIARRFTFLNHTRVVADWSAPGASRLWRFHLHGFGYALDLAIAARRGQRAAGQALDDLVRSWLGTHPVDASDAWHPFVASERLIAWLVARDLWPPLREVVDEPILLHALYVDRHLETDVGGNHLLKNLVALLLAGCAFDGPGPARWRTRASTLLQRQLQLQILPDGGHYERSPMYHLLVLADLLIALLAAGRRDLDVAQDLAQAVTRMQRVARSLVHPDGDIPLFNDSVLSEAPRPDQLIGPATDPAPPCLPLMGYASLAMPAGVLIADCGPPGPDDLPAHVHADALSFELSIGQQRVLVDGGVFDYTAGPRRDHLRGTAAHNTVQVDGANQTEVWGTFRVGQRARVRLDRCTPDLLVASHDGYARLGVRHERRIDAASGVGWRVLDTLTGHGQHTADARLRLHPALRWRQQGERFVACDASGRALLQVEPIGAPRCTIEADVYAERFGQLQSVEVLRLQRHGHLPFVFGCWLLLPGAEPVVC
jgi:uncharacterized heparinase superfamily protein